MLISVLVRSCNDETQIAGSLAAIFSQRTEDQVEVIVCDDGSTDGTRGVLAGLGGRIRLLPRPPGPYFPGRTLNALVRAARGEIAVFNNADAVPLDERWLEGLVAPLKAGAAAATFANQLPRADATSLVRRDYLRAFGDGRAAATWPRFFSLASAAARRADLLAHPFDETLHYSEDVEWAYRRPIRRVYVPTARVEHSHNYTMAELRRRFYGWMEANEFNEPNVFAPIATIAAFKQGEEWRKQMLAYVEGNILFTEQYFKEHIPGIRVVRPESSFLVWLDCRALGLGHDELQDLFINKARLALNDGEIFDTEANPYGQLHQKESAARGFMRLNVGTPRSILTQALEQLAQAVASLPCR